MKNVKMMISFLIVLLSVSFTGIAAAYQPPGWCFMYSTQDNFEGNSDKYWTHWGTNVGGQNYVGDMGVATSGTNALTEYLNPHHPNGLDNSFLAADKWFSATGNYKPSLNYKNPTNNFVCPTHIPYFPNTGSIVGCYASVWIYSKRGASGLIEIIDPDTYQILGQQLYTMDYGLRWFNLFVYTNYWCQDAIIVRLELDENTVYSDDITMDDLQVSWYTTN